MKHLLILLTFIVSLCFSSPVSAAVPDGRALSITLEELILLLDDNEECITCPSFTNYGKLLDDLEATPWFKTAVVNSANSTERGSLFRAWDILTKSESSFAGVGLMSSEDVVQALARDLRGADGEDLRVFLNTAPDSGVDFIEFQNRVRAWEVARQYTDPTDIPLLTRLVNDMEVRPNLASLITDHIDPDGAFYTWNRVSLGERFVAETKFYNVMDELVPPGVNYNYVWRDPDTGDLSTWGAPTSGLKIYSNAPEGTFIIGGFGPDLKYILPQFPTATIGDPIELILPDHINQLNDRISAGFPQPFGSQFNLLNVYDPLFFHVLDNAEELVTYGTFIDRGAGEFFTFINGPWMDAAVSQNKLILVASNINEYVYQSSSKLTGFGKEIHRLEWIHGYRFNPVNNTMVQLGEAEGLPTLTKIGDLDHGF